MDGLYFCRMAVPRFCQTRTGPPKPVKTTWIVYGDLLRIVTGDSSLLELNIGGGFKYFVLFSPRKLGKILAQCDLRIFFHMGWFNHQLENPPSGRIRFGSFSIRKQNQVDGIKF